MDDEANIDLVGIVGDNLRRLRIRRGLTLERLAKASGVSRAMLGQIELGRSAPTINLMWKISRALEIPVSAMIAQAPGVGTTVLRQAEAKYLKSQDGSFSSRALYPSASPRRVEFCELHLAAQSLTQFEGHPLGTTKNLVVARGRLEVVIHGRTHLLEAGDAIFFEGDLPHSLHNPGPGEGLYYLVVTHVDAIG